jgi:CubicO group peptidase (beta-lactamase class C family)
VTVGIVSGPDLVWTHSFGYADIEQRRLATRESVYRIGSITKQFTALMFLQLVQEGKVHLSDPVEKYLPELSKVAERRPWAPPITLVQLATMTSGMDREPAHLENFLKGPVSEWEKVMIAALGETRFQFEPDTHYFYSNIGYAMLGASLARAAGRPYADYVRERIFQALGMKRTALEPNPEIQASIAKGYEIGRDGTLDSDTPAREHAGRGYKVPNGAIYTTVDDLARFLAFELDEGPESVLPRKTWADNLTRVNSASGDLTSGYGIGFQVYRRGSFVYYGHGGSVAGYRAAALFEPDSKTAAVVLRNVGGRFDVSGLCEKALEEAAGAKQAARKP